MIRYVFSYYDGDELVLYRESQTPDDHESDMPYLGFHKHGQIADNVTDGIVKRWNS